MDIDCPGAMLQEADTQFANPPRQLSGGVSQQQVPALVNRSALGRPPQSSPLVPGVRFGDNPQAAGQQSEQLLAPGNQVRQAGSQKPTMHASHNQQWQTQQPSRQAASRPQEEREGKNDDVEYNNILTAYDQMQVHASCTTCFNCLHAVRVDDCSSCSSTSNKTCMWQQHACIIKPDCVALHAWLLCSNAISFRAGNMHDLQLHSFPIVVDISSTSHCMLQSGNH